MVVLRFIFGACDLRCRSGANFRFVNSFLQPVNLRQQQFTLREESMVTEGMINKTRIEKTTKESLNCYATSQRKGDNFVTKKSATSLRKKRLFPVDVILYFAMVPTTCIWAKFFEGRDKYCRGDDPI